MRSQLKDREKILIRQMDPSLLETLKNIVRKDVKFEHEKRRMDPLGCTDKCKLMNKMLEIDAERHSNIAV